MTAAAVEGGEGADFAADGGGGCVDPMLAVIAGVVIVAAVVVDIGGGRDRGRRKCQRNWIGFESISSPLCFGP